MLTANYNGYKVNLIQNIDDFETMKSRMNPQVMIGLDTETTGLDFCYDYVVGICISLGPSYTNADYQGYYIPIAHQSYDNFPKDVVIPFIQDVISNYKTCFFNRNFDVSMLAKEGIKFPFTGHMHDAQIMCHLIFGESLPALKDYVKRFLKFDVIEFESTNSKDHNFGTTNPEISYVYAAQDPLVTVLLARKLWAEYPYIRRIYPLDNKATDAIRRLSSETILPLDFDVLDKELERVNDELSKIKNEIFSFVGYQFKLNSTRDKGDALSRFVTLTVKTKGGQYAVNDEVLSRIDHPLARMFQKYAELEKYRGSYVAKMANYPKEGIRINYSACNVSTGRLSSGSSKGNTFYADFNIQNVPKIELKKYVWLDDALGYIVSDKSTFAVESCESGPIQKLCEIKFTDGSSFKVDGNASVRVAGVGYCQVKNLDKFIPVTISEVQCYTTQVTDCHFKNLDFFGPIGKMKVKGGLRDAFPCPEGYVWLNEDYSSQEMVVMANLSREPHLIEPLLNGLDIHNYVAKQMFGFEDPAHRTQVKILNFAVNYGANAPTISRKLSCSRQKAQELLDKYDSTLSNLTRWKREQEKEARRKGMVFTYFGRPRVLSMYYNSSNSSDWAFADRSAVNSPVQGFGGDLIRRDLVMLVDQFLNNPEFRENCKFSCTVHDEINLYVKPHYLGQAYKILTSIMEFAPSNFKVPVKTSPAIGVTWGTLCESDGVSPNNRIIINRDKIEPLEGKPKEELNDLLNDWESRENY